MTPPSCAGDPSVLRQAQAISDAPKRRRGRKKKGGAKSTKASKPSVGLEADEEAAMRQRMRGNHAPLFSREGVPHRYVCSEPWIDAQFKRFEDRGPEDEPIVYRFHDATVFPPAGGSPGMKRCRGCGRVTPPQNVRASGHCDDCFYGAMTPLQLSKLGKSAGVIDMGKVKSSRRRGEEYSS